MNAKSIVILGSGRSGTSFLANLLHSNGVYAGNCTGGTLENVEVRKINDSYLEKYYDGITRSKLPYGILPDEEIVVNKEYQQKALTFMHSMNEHVNLTIGQSSWWDDSNNYWMFKDPRTTLLHDMWVEHCDIIVGVFRNPVEVVNSYMKLLDVYYPGDEREQGFVNMLNYWKRFNQSLIHVFGETDNFPMPKYLLDFNDDVEKQIRELFKQLNIPMANFNYDKNKIEQESDSIYDDNEVIDIFDKIKEMKNLI